MERLIEQPSGRGSVTRADGTPLRPMRYALRVYQGVHDARMSGPLRVEGWVHVEGQEGFSFGDEKAELTLTLEGGRVLDFVLQNSSGQIANRSQRFTSPRAKS